MDVMKVAADPAEAPEGELRVIDRDDMMWSDTVHYMQRPVIAHQAEGELVVDVDGVSYVDSQMWHSSVNFGYGNSIINEAVHAQLDRLPQVSGDLLHEEKLRVAKEINDAVRERFGIDGRVAFNVSGSLVVEDALKIARRATGHQGVAAYMGGYHGRTLALSAVSSSHRYRAPYGTFPDKATLLPYPDCGACFYDKDPTTCGLFCAGQTGKLLSNEFYGLASDSGTDHAAILVEPCQGRGYAVPSADYFALVAPQFQERGVLVIDDEIQAGLWRTGPMFAVEHLDFTPDIMVLGKSLTNGVSPLSAVWARADLVDPANFGPGHTHSNFANHSLGTAAALATLRYARSRDYESRVPTAGQYYLSRLQLLADSHKCVASVSGRGLLLRIVLRDQSGQPWRHGARRAAQLAQDHDVIYRGERLRLILNPGGYHSEVIKLAPWLDISIEGIDRQIALLDATLARLATEPEAYP